MSESQRILLHLASSYPLRDGGVIEAQIATGLQGAALEACIAALERRGYIDAKGYQTDKGRARLAHG